MKKFVEIAVELPVEGVFTYEVPPALLRQLSAGKRALAPFGKRTVTGYITALLHSSPSHTGEIKEIIDILDDEPLFDAARLEFYRWVSSYYFAPIGEVLALTHPGNINLKSQRRLSITEEGRKALIENSCEDRAVLEAAQRGATVSALQKKLPGKPVNSVIRRLKAAGLLTEEVAIRGGGREKTALFVSPAIDLSEYAPEGRSMVQARVVEFLRARGASFMSEMKKELGEVAAAVKKLAEKGVLLCEEKQVLRNGLSDITPKQAPPEPNDEQKKAIYEISAAIKGNGFSPFLLWGVTGSGKTLVYLKALEEAVRSGKKAIILSPEIALTPWPAAYLLDMFPGKVAVYHSGLSEGARYDEWMRILKGEADIVVGARSALFTPVKDLGLIIVDEEHEASYKQEDGVRYHARDAALKLGATLGITVVLGSATPSLETFYNASTGKLKLLAIKDRATGGLLPEIEVQDMKGLKEVFSDRLKELLAKTLEDKHQALLFLNRRGFSNSIICRDCGHIFMCLNCSVSLTVHKKKGALRCHYCDLAMPLPDECPKCRGTRLTQPGAGTEKVEEEVRGIFPDVRTRRMDRDTTSGKGSAKKIMDAVESREVDILIGTQMVAKGHHFPSITLVGIISGDTSLGLPDFRSAERTFQLITQAAGRAGRGEKPGVVLLQTMNPGHYCFKTAVNHDYEAFYKEEITFREELSYPPFTRLCNIRIDGLNEKKVIEASTYLREAALKSLSRTKGVDILGPSPALIPRVRNRYRWQMLIKGSNLGGMRQFLLALKAAVGKNRFPGVSFAFDMDPINTI